MVARDISAIMQKYKRLLTIPSISNKLKAIFTIPFIFLLKVFGKRDRGEEIYKSFFKETYVNLYGFKFFVRSFADAFHVFEDFEKETTDYLKSFSGEVFIDIGTHIGRYSIILSRNFKKIVAIEADPLNFSILLKNIKINGGKDKVIPLNIAAHHCKEILKFERPDYEKNTGLTRVTSSNRYDFTIESNTIDNILQNLHIQPSRVSLVKIDVEGHELSVLRGMTTLLTSGNPILIIEILENNRKNKEEVLAFLGNFGYKLEMILDNVNYVFVKSKQ